MATGAKDSETYLEGWRKFVFTAPSSDSKVLELEAEKIIQLYNNKKLKHLIKNGGWNKASPNGN